MAIVANSIEAIDRALEAFGFEDELEGKTPRAARVAVFRRGELRDFLLGALRKADRPLSSGELAWAVYQTVGKDACDRRLVADVARRVGCALRKMRAARIVGGHRGRSGAAGWLVSAAKACDGLFGRRPSQCLRARDTLFRESSQGLRFWRVSRGMLIRRAQRFAGARMRQ